jgi:hypothetical protein
MGRVRAQLTWKSAGLVAWGAVGAVAGLIVAGYPTPLNLALASATFAGLVFVTPGELRHLRADPGARARRELKKAVGRMRPADLWFNREQRLFYRRYRSRRKTLLLLEADAVAGVMHGDAAAVTVRVLQVAPGAGTVQYTDGLRWDDGALAGVPRSWGARWRILWMMWTASPLVVAGEAEIREALAGLAGAELVSASR